MSVSLESIIPDRLNDPSRFSVVADRHLRAFRWEKQDWIPLGLIVNDPQHSEGITYEQWLNPEVFLKLQAKILRDTLEVGSDIMPTIALNHMGNAMFPSVFGANVVIPTDQVTSVQDLGPWILPILGDIRQVDNMVIPVIRSGLVSEAERFMQFYRGHLPDWVKVVSPSKVGPFSLAELLRGSEFYVDLIDEPERCERLLQICTDSLMDIERYLRNVANQPSQVYYSEYGIRGHGLRLGEDSIINISSRMIQKFVLPYITQLAQSFGGRAYIHFCTLENSHVEHLYEVLAKDPDIFAASSQFGFQYYEKNIDRLEGRLAIESFYGGEPIGPLDYVINKFGSFQKWATWFVPRFKDRSGLVLYFEVRSVEEGKQYWKIWQTAHEG